MKTCNHCDGDLLRHGVSRHKNGDIYGVRYICRECRASFTVRCEDRHAGVLNYGMGGRPTVKDWRMSA